MPTLHGNILQPQKIFKSAFITVNISVIHINHIFESLLHRTVILLHKQQYNVCRYKGCHTTNVIISHTTRLLLHYTKLFSLTGNFIIVFLVIGCTSSFGLFFAEFMVEFRAPASSITIALSVQTIVFSVSCMYLMLKLT